MLDCIKLVEILLVNVIGILVVYIVLNLNVKVIVVVIESGLMVCIIFKYCLYLDIIVVILSEEIVC